MKGTQFHILSLLWIVLHLHRPSAATSFPTCTEQNPVPVYYPLRNVTLNDGTIRRGAAVSFGTPSQPFAFLLATTYNNTYLNDDASSGCSLKSTMLYCSNGVGGLFNEGNSSTWSPETSNNTSNQHYKLGSDTLLVNDTLSIPDFSLSIVGSVKSQNLLGLGRNSTLLNALISAGAIFSKTVSIFQGWTGAQTETQTDGSLIIGGYDLAKITGNQITLPFIVDHFCTNGLAISVTDVNMNLRSGVNISIIGESRRSGFRACIDTSSSTISLPEEIWWAFTNVTEVAEIGHSRSPLGWEGMIIPARGAYDGDITFSITSELDIRIPNHQLVVPDIAINSKGQQYEPNSTVAEVLINSLEGAHANDRPIFGMPFLSSAYLIVDIDQQQFRLSRSQQSDTSYIVALGPSACNVPAPSTSTSQDLPSVLANSTSALNPTPGKSSSGIPVGAIVGAVIGGLAVIAVSAGLFFYLRSGMPPSASKRQQSLPQVMTPGRGSRQGIPIHEMPDTSVFHKPGYAI